MRNFCFFSLPRRLQKGHAEHHLYSERMVLPLWRSLYSLNLMLPKEDRKAMLLRLYNEDTPLMDHSKDRFHDKSKPQPDADVIKETDGAKDEEVDADVEDEKAAINEESEDGIEGGVRLGEDVETTEDGAGDEAAESRDDELSAAVQAQLDDGV